MTNPTNWPNPKPLPDLMTVPDVLERLKGKVGRTRLLEHLKRTPHYNGGPTFRWWGKKFIFSPEDYQRLIESMECHSSSPRSSTRKTGLSVGLSRAGEYWKVREQQTKNRQRNTEESAKPSFGKNEFTAHARL
ncbi:hypothetical protein [Acetobacter orientalis]|uniref:hypothetical protein n=1 Tax=Acetobacter orientalis TaxID=146474 RepID=UPI0039EC1E41